MMKKVVTLLALLGMLLCVSAHRNIHENESFRGSIDIVPAAAETGRMIDGLDGEAAVPVSYDPFYHDSALLGENIAPTAFYEGVDWEGQSELLPAQRETDFMDKRWNDMSRERAFYNNDMRSRRDIPLTSGNDMREDIPLDMSRKEFSNNELKSYEMGKGASFLPRDTPLKSSEMDMKNLPSRSIPNMANKERLNANRFPSGRGMGMSMDAVAQAPTSSDALAQVPTSMDPLAQAPTSLAQVPIASYEMSRENLASYDMTKDVSSYMGKEGLRNTNDMLPHKVLPSKDVNFQSSSEILHNSRKASIDHKKIPSTKLHHGKHSRRLSGDLEVANKKKGMLDSVFGHSRRLLQATPIDVCTSPPSCAAEGPYVECNKGGRISCQCSWVARCQPNVSDCYYHTNDKIFTSCGF